MSEMIRLDRFISECGAGSRKQAVNYIKAGRVTVEGVTVKEPGYKIPEDAPVTFDGCTLKYSRYSYYMLNKPAGCVSAVKDGLSDTVMACLEGVNTRGLFPVGRLDKDTEGLLIITNDGDLCHHLTSPGRHVKKTYYVIADKKLPRNAAEKFLAGIDIGDETKCLPAELKAFRKKKEGYPYELTITEGRFHQVKRMFYAFDAKVLYLKRLSEGDLMLDEKLKPGSFRPLSEEEVKSLKEV
jgi:16S rRNA pseudouridine516 synthase